MVGGIIRAMNRILLISLFGVVGVITRLAVSDWAPRHIVMTFPWATFFVNITGSLVLGIVYAITPSDLPVVWRSAIGIGGMGALTTFSTMMFETMRLIDEGELALATTYALGTLAVGLAAMYIGTTIGRRI